MDRRVARPEHPESHPIGVTQERSLGALAQLSGQTLATCPFRRGKIERDEWMDGFRWAAALPKDQRPCERRALAKVLGL